MLAAPVQRHATLRNRLPVTDRVAYREELPVVTPNPIADGSEIEALTAMRSVLAERLGESDGTAAAAVSRELRAVLVELRRLGAGVQESTVDDIAAQRAKRRAARAAPATDPGGTASG
jgi:hypothetical protein